MGVKKGQTDIDNSRQIEILTQFSGGFDIDVVDTGTDPNDYSQGFELFEIFFRKSDGVPHECTDRFVKNFFVDFLSRLRVTEGNGRHVFENWHFHRTVPTIQ